MTAKLRRQSTEPLPHLPLHFAYPLNVAGAGVEGGAVLAEIPGEQAMDVLRALRLVMAWCRGKGDADLAHADSRAALDALRRRASEPALAELVRELGKGERASPQLVSEACYRVGEWARGEGAPGTAALFIQAAALAHPECATSAWKTGRELRDHNHPREAEVWLNRASRVAVWNGETDMQALSLNSLANLFLKQGAPRAAQEILLRAAALARRLGSERRAGISHDLLVVCIELDEFEFGEEVAAAALRQYGPRHPRVPKLAHDAAVLWMRAGKFAQALPVLLQLERHIEGDRLLLLASTAQAAGALGEEAVFARAWSSAWALIEGESPEIGLFLPEALLNLGTGAASLDHWDDARHAFARALEEGAQAGQHDVVGRAEAGLQRARRHQSVEVMQPATEAGTAFSAELVSVLR